MTTPLFSTHKRCRALMELHPDLRDEPFMNTDDSRIKIEPRAPMRLRPEKVCTVIVLTTLIAWLSLGYYLD